MKIGILTQPLSNNYGGLLQCYALMTVLKRKGHQPVVICRVPKCLKKGWISFCYRWLKNIILSIKRHHYISMMTNDQSEIISRNTSYFVKKYINPRTTLLYSDDDLQRHVSETKYDAFIVGSDQCWRPKYSPHITNYFLDFIQTSQRRYIRLAYAASFGVNNWEFNKKETKQCIELAKKFNGISVREFSGVELCRDYLGVNVVPVLDPTMLLEKEDYEGLVDLESEPRCKGSLFYYILDENPNINSLIQSVSSKCGLTPFKIMPKSFYLSSSQTIEDCVYPRVTQWIRAFMDAEMIVTDSFHGCVFSIMFNKPFWVIGNKSRGLARFDSLLSVFGLQKRLLKLDQGNDVNWDEPIDWNEVNRIRKNWQEKSYAFLFNYL